MGANKLRGVSVYRETLLEFATGDRIQITQSDKEHRIRSGDFATVEPIADDNGPTVSLDNGKSFELTRDEAKHIDSATRAMGRNALPQIE